jgi:hypothetical protein
MNPAPIKIKLRDILSKKDAIPKPQMTKPTK